jgi:hypothetical protein
MYDNKILHNQQNKTHRGSINEDWDDMQSKLIDIKHQNKENIAVQINQ